MANSKSSHSVNIQIWNNFSHRQTPQLSLVGKWHETTYVNGNSTPVQQSTIEISKHTSQGIVEGKVVGIDYNIHGHKLSYITISGVMKGNQLTTNVTVHSSGFKSSGTFKLIDENTLDGVWYSSANTNGTAKLRRIK